MPNLQEYLNQTYPTKQEKERVGTIYFTEIKEKQREIEGGELDLSEFVNLAEVRIDGSYLKTPLTKLKLSASARWLGLLICINNNLTSIDFLENLPNPKLMKILNIYNNNIQPTDIEIFSKFSNLTCLKIGTEKGAFQNGKHNKFYGSLKSYQNLTKLERICIEATDVDSGLEHLPMSLAKSTAKRAADNKYDLIIIDAPARTSQGTLEIAKKADLLIQPVGTSRDDLLPALREFNALKAQGINKKKLLFVLNHLSTPAEVLATQEYLTESTYNFAPYYLLEKASYRQAQSEGKSISEVNYTSLRKQVQNKRKIFGEIPQEISENIKASETAPSDKRISGRTKQLNFKVREEFYWKLKNMAVEEKCMMVEVLEKSLEDLFAGIGGFRLALEKLNGKCLFSSEIDEDCIKTYAVNFGEQPQGDITKIDPQSIPNHDILCAGFPCQPFSISGKKKGFKDIRDSGLIFCGYRNKLIRTNGVRPNTEHLSRVHKQPNRIYFVDGTHPTIPSQESSGRYWIYDGKKVRKLTLNECFALQGFPSNYQKRMSINIINHKEKLLEVYQKSSNVADISNISDEMMNFLKIITDNIDKNKGVYTVLITLMVHKLLEPEQDIRLHKIEFKNGFSGRTIDTKHITPTLRELGLPAMAERKGMKEAFLKVIDAFQNDQSITENMLRIILNKAILFKENNLIEIRKLDNADEISITAIIELLKKHFTEKYDTWGGSKLPVLAFYAIYKSLILEVDRYKSCKLEPLGSHTASDRTSKSAGDIQVIKNDRVFEAVEIKLDRPIDINMARIAYEKIIKFNSERYYILSDMRVLEKDQPEVNELILKIKEKHGCQLIVNGILPTLKYYLRLISNPKKFFNEYIELVEDDTELKTIHKNKLKSLVEEIEKVKCPQCLKLVPESETDNCDGCGKNFCVECLTYQGEKGSEGELVFCPKCEKE
ncbi:8344_t:CDS:2 [Ambispora leptoticha]|uniref:8344_t:CDS:1 n=1 Tax=Ambispora leptoticha TaxID=144679 RepID=A0A9N9D1W7_9GLOM|nr:8344_t:CDS:2 [Ambispora leptoticha]